MADWQFRQLPLTVEDLVDVSYDGYLYQRSGSDSPLLGQFPLSQWPEPWGAEAAYQLTYQDSGPLSRYLLCYPSCLVELRLDWTPTAAQMTAVGQAFCS